MGRFLVFIYLAVMSLLSACVTPPPASIDLAEALDKNIAITIPMSLSEKGLVVLKDVKINGRSITIYLLRSKAAPNK
jgi:hypothetical protein